MCFNKHLEYFAFLLLFVQGSYQLSCPKPKGQNCKPIGRTPASCITQIEDGTGLTWFSMQERCTTDDGRLVWLKDDFTSVHLTNTVRSSLKATTFIPVGLLQSLKGDDYTFWRTPGDNTTFSCGPKDTNICLSSATSKNCSKIGCCWVNGKCQYPEQQWLIENNRSAVIDTSAVAATTTRRCVGLQKSGSTWTLKAYDCSTPRAAGTGFVCEYKCGKDWPNTSMSQRNITWPVNSTAGIATSTTLRTTGATNTGPDRNEARGVFDTQAVTRVIVTSFIALLALTSCSLTW